MRTATDAVEATPVGAASDADPVDRRSRQRERTRNRVYDCAIALFVERGYDGTTMDDIAERADVARATVFNHFPRKVEFLNEWGHRRRVVAFEAVHSEHLDTHHLSQVLTRYMRELGRISTSSRPETVALMTVVSEQTNYLVDPPLARDLGRYITRAKARGEVPPEVDPDQAGLLLAAAYFVVLTNWIAAEPEPFDLTDRLVDTLSLLLPGLTAARPRRLSSRKATGAS